MVDTLCLATVCAMLCNLGKMIGPLADVNGAAATVSITVPLNPLKLPSLFDVNCAMVVVSIVNSDLFKVYTSPF